jgi:tetratricopeptide (TPR) repeat protein
MTNSNESPEALLQRAFESLKQGDAAAAELRCRRVLDSAPDHVLAMSILGPALNAQGRCTEAAFVFTQLTRLDPRERSHWMNLGTTLRSQRRFDEALAAYARAAQLSEASADFFFNVGLLHYDRGDFVSARAVLVRAHALAPTDPEIAFYAAQACNECLHSPEAVEILGDPARFDNLTGELASKIALLLMNLREARRAEPFLTRAVADPAPNLATLLNIVQLHERVNRTEQALTGLEELKASPGVAGLSDDLVGTEAKLAQREGRHEQARELFLQALAGNVEQYRRHHVLFPLAKSLDVLKRYDEAWDALMQAHASQLELLRLTHPDAAQRSAPPLFITHYSCDPADVQCWNETSAPTAQESPVFIVAFPRSGTTLLEQTLDAHPLLQAMDEQPYLQHTINHLMGKGIDYPAGLARASPELLQETRARYWEEIRERVDLKPGQRLIDKNPLNLLRLPIIRRLFPNASIVLAIRHPCDVVMSCFMQHFRAFEFVVLCKDLPTLADGYRRSFDFWYQQVELLRPRVYEVRYESFVSGFETQVRALSEFLQLPWNDAMLAPGENARAKGYISTPSYEQVIQPINTRAVGRWRRYAQHFAPVMPVLQPYLERWGYESR